MLLIRPIKTRSRYGSGISYSLTLQHRVTRRLILQKPRSQTFSEQAQNIVLPLLVSKGFQVLFHYPPGVLFTFPSRYFFTIGHMLVFSLGWWSTQIPTRFLVSRGTQESVRFRYDFQIRDYHPLWLAFPVLFF